MDDVRATYLRDLAFTFRYHKSVADRALAQIAALRNSTEYKRGYHMLEGILPELKKDDAVTACVAISGGHSQRALGFDPHEPGPERK